MPFRTSPTLVLVTLFAGAFVMGCAEMLVVGLLDEISADLRVSVPDAGALVTANALGLALGGPLLAVLTARFDRRRVIVVSAAAFTLGNLVPVLLPDYTAFMVARVGIGAVQGLFIAAAFTVATSIVPPERAGRAMAVVISGFASASAFGLPVGTLLGQAIGWRGSFAAVVAIALVVLVAAFAVVPSVPAQREHGTAGLARLAFAPRVLAILALCLVIFVAIQSALTYVVPYLGEVAAVSGPVVSLFLLGYGVATTAGSAIGGRFADANASRTLVVGSIGVVASLVALLLLGSNPVAAGLAIVGLGVFGMGMAPSMQHRVARLAGAGAPLAASLPASAVNGGIALGAAIGGVTIDVAGVPAVPITGAAVGVIAVALAVVTARISPAAPASESSPDQTVSAHPTPARKEP